MKKFFFSLVAVCAMLLSSCSNNGLEGTWLADANEVMGEDMSKYDKCEFMLTFDDGKVKLGVDCSGTTGQEKLSMELGFSLECEGTYKQNDDKLKLDFSKAKPSVNIYKFKVNADDATKKILESMGMDEKSMKDQVQAQMESQDFAGNALIGEDELTIKLLEGDELVLVSDNKEYNLKRK